jgi:threonylcarbamoyladenosine tRNA methylthiotransferase CDKAL1
MEDIEDLVGREDADNLGGERGSHASLVFPKRSSIGLTHAADVDSVSLQAHLESESACVYEDKEKTGAEDGCCGGGSGDCAAQGERFQIAKHVSQAKDVSEYQGGRDEAALGVPGTQRIFIKTYGCSHNVSDSEYMAGLLSSYGYRVTESAEEADLCVINSCTVKDPSQAAFSHLVKTVEARGKPVVVAGCVPQADKKVVGLERASVVGVHQIDRVVEVVERTLAGEQVKLLGSSRAYKGQLPALDLPKVRKNELVEIIPLSTGCLGACTYCKTRHARGKLGSYPPAEIFARVASVVREGVVREIWLSSEDTGAYGIDLGTDIAHLLRGIVALLPDDQRVMLRVGMTNPPYILAHLDAVAEVA